MVATAVKAMASFQDADAAFRADAPSLPATEPALPFIGVPRRRLRTRPRQYHPTHTTINGGLFIGGRAEAAIRDRQIRCATKQGVVPNERRLPQGDVRRAPRMHLIGRDDLV